MVICELVSFLFKKSKSNFFPTKAALVVDLLWLPAGETAVVGDVGRLCPEQQHL